MFTLAADILTVRPRPALSVALSGEAGPETLFPLPLRVSPDALEQRRTLARRWDIHGLEDEWRSWVADKGSS